MRATTHDRRWRRRRRTRATATSTRRAGRRRGATHGTWRAVPKWWWRTPRASWASVRKRVRQPTVVAGLGLDAQREQDVAVRAGRPAEEDVQAPATGASVATTASARSPRPPVARHRRTASTATGTASRHRRPVGSGQPPRRGRPPSHAGPAAPAAPVRPRPLPRRMARKQPTREDEQQALGVAHHEDEGRRGQTRTARPTRSAQRSSPVSRRRGPQERGSRRARTGWPDDQRDAGRDARQQARARPTSGKSGKKRSDWWPSGP